MKVVLLVDVPKLGHKHEVREVKRGFGRNFLLPRGLAEIGTPSALIRVEKHKAEIAQRAALSSALKNEAFGEIGGQTFSTKEKANEQGHLFEGLSAEDVLKIMGSPAKGLRAEWLKLKKPIKEIGEHKLSLDDGEEKVEFTLAVEAI